MALSRGQPFAFAAGEDWSESRKVLQNAARKMPALVMHHYSSGFSLPALSINPHLSLTLDQLGY